MGIKIIDNFDLAKSVPLDSRQEVADSTARLALTRPYKGLKARQMDNDKYYEYIGDETTNVSGDWRQIITLHRGVAAPAAGLGFVDDVFIDENNRVYYLKTGASTWTAQFTFDGSQILISLTDPPDNGVGNNGDIAIHGATGNLYKKAAGVWAFQFSIKGADGADGTDGQSDIYATTSSTSINLDTLVEPLSITVDTGLSFTVGQSVVVASRADNDNNVVGSVVSYNSGTGALVLDDLTINGTGTHTDWDVNLSGAVGANGADGAQGRAFIHNEHDINLTQAKITAIQAGGYTTQAPWSASVLNDTRSPSELVATANIQGSMVDHSISWDGVQWYDNGIWRGRTGNTGNPGAPGAPGSSGTNGFGILRQLIIDSSGTYSPTEASPGHYHYAVLIYNGIGLVNLNLPQLSIGVKTYEFTIQIYGGGGTTVRIRGWQNNAIHNVLGNSVGDLPAYVEYTNGSNTSFYDSKRCIHIMCIDATHYVVDSESPALTEPGTFIQQGEASLDSQSLGLTSIVGDFGTYNGRIYGYFAFNFTLTNPRLIPKIWWQVGLGSDSATIDIVQISIERSLDAVNWTELKKSSFRIAGSNITHYVSQQFLDLLCPKTLVYYRFIAKNITVGQSSNMSNTIDFTIESTYNQ